MQDLSHKQRIGQYGADLRLGVTFPHAEEIWTIVTLLVTLVTKNTRSVPRVAARHEATGPFRPLLASRKGIRLHNRWPDPER